MKKLAPFIVAILVAYYIYDQTAYDDEVVDSSYAETRPPPSQITPTEQQADEYFETTDALLERAFRERRTSYQVRGRGTVARVLSDDNDGSRHQRFILRLDSGLSLLIAHNIDLAPRVDSLQAGDTVSFFGEYEWNARGGLIHWTHHDPNGHHVTGWLEHDGRRYQ